MEVLLEVTVSTGEAVLKKFPEPLGLFYVAKQASIRFSLLIDDRENVDT